jgi:hypothetical protein
MLGVVLCGTVTACSSEGDGPDAVCASPPPGETLTECKDFGDGEGPLGG